MEMYMDSRGLAKAITEDTPTELIERLRPDVLVKGADYTLEQVVGAERVRAYGGRVLLAELLPGHATSDIFRDLWATGTQLSSSRPSVRTAHQASRHS